MGLVKDKASTTLNGISEFQSECDKIFKLQNTNKYKVAKSTAKERIKKLKLLKQALVVTYNAKIKEAVYKDLRKHEVEA